MSFTEKLKKEIASQQISISEFERRAGLNRNIVQNILLGKSKNPSMKTLQAISQALGYSTHELINLMNSNEDQQSKKPGPVNLETLKICCNHLITKLIEMDVDISLNDYSLLLRDIYNYQNENPNKKEVDEVFVKWIIKKNLNLR